MTRNIIGAIKLEPSSAPTAAKGVLYYDTSTDEFKGCTDGASFGSIGGGGSLQDAYDGGNSIDVSGSAITITQSSTTGNCLYIARDLAAASTDNEVVSFRQINTGDDKDVFQINQNSTAGGRCAVFYSSDNRTIENFRISDAAGKDTVKLGMQQTSADGSNLFYRDYISGSTAGPVVSIQNANSGDDQFTLQVDQAILSQYAARIRNASDALRVDLASQSSSFGSSFFYRNLASAATGGPVVQIQNWNTSDDKDCLYLDNRGTGEVLYVYTNATTNSTNVIEIEQANASTARDCISVTNAGTGIVLDMSQNNASGSYFIRGINSSTNVVMALGQGPAVNGTFQFTRDLSSASTASRVVYINNDNAGDDQFALEVRSDASQYTCRIFKTSSATSGGGALYVLSTKANSAEPTLLVHQSNSSGNCPAMEIEQNDTTNSFIEFTGTDQGTSHTSVSNSVMVKINGTTRYINLYS